MHCQCISLRRAWPHLLCALLPGSCGLQWDVAQHPEPSLHQAGQVQVPQPHLHHVLQPLHHLGVVGWAPACLPLGCGCPGLRYAAFARTDYRGAIAALDLQTQPTEPPVLFCFSSWLAPSLCCPTGLFPSQRQTSVHLLSRPCLVLSCDEIDTGSETSTVMEIIFTF